MNPFRKRSKSASAGEDRKARKGKVSNPTQTVSSSDIAFILPSENAFRTSLLMPKMADRFSLLRIDDQQGDRQETGKTREKMVEQSLQSPTTVYRAHARDLSVLQEWDEEEDDLPVRPWERREGFEKKQEPYLPEGMSKDEFMRVRAQEGNSLFSGKQRTFKIRSEDGNGTNCLEKLLTN
jgi:hypothetical protein